MKRAIAGLVLLGALAALPRFAAADLPVIQLGEAYAVEPHALDEYPTAYLPLGSAYGETLTVVGLVETCRGPLAGIGDGAELTLVLSDLVVSAVYWAHDFWGYNGGDAAEYSGGFLRVYARPAPGADFSDRSGFSEGELLLEAETVVLQRLSDYRYLQPTELTLRGRFRVTGGSEFARVAVDGVGPEWVLHGTYTDDPASCPPATSISATSPGSRSTSGPTGR